MHQLAAIRQPLQLLAQKAPLLAAAQSQLTDQLFVSGPPSGQPLDVAQQFAVRHHCFRCYRSFAPAASRPDRLRPAPDLTSRRSRESCESAAAPPATRSPCPSEPSQSRRSNAPLV